MEVSTISFIDGDNLPAGVVQDNQATGFFWNGTKVCDQVTVLVVDIQSPVVSFIETKAVFFKNHRIHHDPAHYSA
ncbi:MAG TPA: hypothetical protein DIT99_02830 [Candidatus Latescibacteria bacterium]|jgi:hypothetical protein|nr:hypothetical protein [Candidatus Latescibacterota bacterium]